MECKAEHPDGLLLGHRGRLGATKGIDMRGILLILLLMLTACATMTDEAAGVVVHSQMSNLLNDCKRLGDVSSTVNVIEHMDVGRATQQAANNLRDQAFREYGADSVALVNVDQGAGTIASSVTVQGIAFRCDPPG